MRIYFDHQSSVTYIQRSGSVVECLTPDRGATGSSLTGVPALWSVSKTRHCLSERLLMGRKESSQTNKQSNMYGK